MTPERLYEMWKRPSDPPWWKLPYYSHEAQREYGCFGKQHFEALANQEAK